MKSITLHRLDDELAARLERHARASGLSLNKTAQRLLAKSLGMSGPGERDRRADFAALCGIWSKRDAQAFARAAAAFERVDPEDWA